MRTLLLWVASIALIAFQVPSANADTVYFDFTYTCPTCPSDIGTSGSGVNTTTTTATAGEYLVTAATPSSGSAPSILPLNTSPFSNDNLLYYPGLFSYGAPYDQEGVGLQAASDGVDYLLSCTSSGGCFFTENGVTYAITGGSVTETPLPSTWFMLLGGFVGFGFFAYRGMKNNSAAFAAA